MSNLLGPAGASIEGLSQFEKERLKRIEDNKKRMAAMMAGVDVSLLVCSPKVTPARPKKRKAEAVLTTSSERRRSSRISNLPTPLYCIEEDTTERTPGNRSRSSTGPNGRRCHGTPGITADGVADPYICGKMGWKKECGSASLTAAEFATDAALALQRKLTAAGIPAAVKLMSTSQVSGGFWSQLPYDIIRHFGTLKKTIHLHCHDHMAQQDPHTFMYAEAGASRCWRVVYLPKGDGGGSGLSGGWRGFAIDMRLFPNDTVVYEVLDAPPQDTAAAAAAAGNDSASIDSSVHNNQEASQVSASVPTVTPIQRQHLRIHIFRASAYETAAPPPAAPTADTQRQQHEKECSSPQLTTPGGAAAETLLLPTSGSQVSKQQQLRHDTQLCRSDSEISAAAAAGFLVAYNGPDDVLVDVPLAKRRKVAAAAAAMLKDDQGAHLMAAAEAGLLSGVKVTRQTTCVDASSSRKAGRTSQVARQTPVVDDAHEKQRAGLRGSSINSDTAAAASKDNTGLMKRLPRRAAAVAASKAWAPAAGGLRGGSSSSANRPAVSAGLVPKPANPSELVLPPTADEQRRARKHKGAFPVGHIVAHRVNAESGADELLLRWRDYGPYWDTWEPSSSLTHPPGTYDWVGGTAAVPNKFKL